MPTRFVVLGSQAVEHSKAVAGGGAGLAGGIRVVTLKGSEGYDITDLVEGLSWSSVNPGGDERATFRLKRRWFAGAPEIAQGNIVTVMDGINTLWRGRIEDNERSVERAESIGVTALGLGVRLKDSVMREIYVDRDIQSFNRPASNQRRINHESDADKYHHVGEGTVAFDTATGNPALHFSFDRVDAPTAGNAPPRTRQIIETWYDAQGIALDRIYYDVGAYNMPGAGWVVQAFLCTDDITPTADSGSNLQGGGAESLVATAADRKYALFLMYYALNTAAGGDQGSWLITWRKLAAYGRSGIPRIGPDPPGVYASDVVRDIVGRVSAITKRRIDATTFVIPHLVFKEPTSHEDAITETTRFEAADWGTWGSDNVLDTDTNGRFDWKLRDTATQHWFALRSECDDVNLNIELSTLFNEVDVHYTDPSGIARVETRTAAVPALGEQGITRRGRVDGGTLTQAAAQQLGDAFLALSSQQTPARGTITLSQAIKHHTRGMTPAWHIRADGSNLRVPDCLPSRDLFSLAAAPDRRTTFPIKRVEVDASGPVPKVRVEVDQALDLLSTLQARLGLAAELVG